MTKRAGLMTDAVDIMAQKAAATATKRVLKAPMKVRLSGLDESQLFGILVNSIQDYAIFLLDADGNVASWNTGAQKLKGYKPSEIIGKHFSTFYTEEDLKSEKPRRELEICQKYGHVEDEYWRVRKDGSWFWANVIITALYDDDKKLIGYAKVTRDLTERKSHEDELHLANQELRRQRMELEELGRAKDEFISLASHQLRTPATGVKQYLGLVLEGYAGEITDRQQDYLQKANESNDRQIDLVNNLLQVAQLDAGKIVLSRTVSNVGSLVKDVIDEQIDSFKSRKQKVELNIPDVSAQAVLDKMRFRMVLENLIDNASKYTQPGGKISVSVEIKRDELYVSVADTGVGIDPESIPKLFTKFSRIQNELSDSVGGSGLGLYWALRVVELHGGKINIASDPGKGSTFTIQIPMERTNADA